jgi:hypothetical protein
METALENAKLAKIKEVCLYFHRQQLIVRGPIGFVAWEFYVQTMVNYY